MATTMQQLLDRARTPLNDKSKTRWPDTTLLQYANDALRRLRIKRPDIFVGQFLSLPGEKAVGDTFPLGDEYIEAVADYVRARAETHDTEPVEESNVPLYAKLFSDLVGGD